MGCVRKILVAVDFSDDSNAALDFAACLAKDAGAEVLLVHVVEVYTPLVMYPLELPVPLPTGAELQDIAEQGLADALVAMEADGGDIVFLDPRTGEILALASRQAGGTTSRPSTITDPFEPGSTAKLFTAALKFLS